MRHSYGASLSPDGRAFACIINDGDYPFAIQTFRVENDEPGAPGSPDASGNPDPAALAHYSYRERRVTLPVAGSVVRVRHSPDGRWLACELAPDGGEHHQIWAVTTDPADRSAQFLHSDGDASVTLIGWDGGQVAVSAFDLHGTTEGRRVDPATGTCTVIDRRTGSELVEAWDEFGLFRVGPRGQRELLLIDPAGHASPLLPPDLGATSDRGFIVERPDLHDQLRVLIRSDHRAPRFRILAVDYRRAHTDTLVRAPERIIDVAHHEAADLDDFSVTRDGSTMAVLWNLEGVSELEILRLRHTGAVVVVQDRWSVALPGRVASGLSLSDDGSILALTVEDVEMPPRVHFLQVETGEMAPFVARLGVAAEPMRGPQRTQPTHSAHPAQPAQVSAQADAPATEWTGAHDDWTMTPHLLRYEARDGLLLSGWLYRAPGEAQARPTLLHFHGGPEGQSRPQHHDVLREIALAGFNVFTPNVRGSGGSGREYSHADERYARYAGITDVVDTVRFLVAQGVAAEGRVAISGRSYGGYLTLAALAFFPGLFRCGVAACGMSDLLTFYQTTEPWIAAAAYTKYGHPVQDRELLRDLSPLTRIERIAVPVLFIHGGNDTNVPPGQARDALTALKARGIPAELLFFPDEGHTFVKAANRRRIAQKMIALLGKQLLSAQTVGSVR